MTEPKQRKKASHLCTEPGCRKVATNFVGKAAVCALHIPGTMIKKTKPGKSITVRAKPGDKKGQAGMKALLEALGAGTKLT